MNIWSRLARAPLHDWLERGFVPRAEVDPDEGEECYERRYRDGGVLVVAFDFMGFRATLFRDDVLLAEAIAGMDWRLEFLGWHDSQILRLRQPGIDVRIGYAPLPTIAVQLE